MRDNRLTQKKHSNPWNGLPKIDDIKNIKNPIKTPQKYNHRGNELSPYTR